MTRSLSKPFINSTISSPAVLVKEEEVDGEEEETEEEEGGNEKEEEKQSFLQKRQDTMRDNKCSWIAAKEMMS